MGASVLLWDRKKSLPLFYRWIRLMRFISMNLGPGKSLRLLKVPQLEEAHLSRDLGVSRAQAAFPLARSSFVSVCEAAHPRLSWSLLSGFILHTLSGCFSSQVWLPKAGLNSRISSKNLVPPPMCFIGLLLNRSLCGSSGLFRAVSGEYILEFLSSAMQYSCLYLPRCFLLGGSSWKGCLVPSV